MAELCWWKRMMGVDAKTLLVLVAVLQLSSGQRGQPQCGGVFTCADCIADSPDNVWCSEGTTDATRCLTRNISVNCTGAVEDPESFVVEQENENISSTVQVTPQRVSVNIRPGQGVKFNVTVEPFNQYPFDLYMLMDVSGSLEDDVATLQALSAEIVATLASLTGDFGIGFGSFVDKPVVPFVPRVSLMKPDSTECKASLLGCAPPHSYNHILSVTNNSTSFQEILNELKISTSIDSPEGGFDALVQAMVCPQVIGWRSDSVHMLLFITDASYHSAGDGKLGMAVLPNDGKCRMEKSPLGDFYEYTGSRDYDYPSVSQVRRLIVETNTLAVFAVTDNVRDIYEVLHDQLRTGVVSTIANDSTNILEVIRESYSRGREEILFQQIGGNGISVSIVPIENCNITIVDGCDGVALGQRVVFEVSVELEECLSAPEEVTLAIPSVGQQVKLLVNSVCQCDCEATAEVDSAMCSGNGDLACGLCECSDGWFGCDCSCPGSIDNPMCPTNNETGVMCSGNNCAFESCLTECECPPNLVGDACECSVMPCRRSDSEDICSGNGVCTCGGCECNPTFSGEHCQCNESTCSSDGEQCSGVGECRCTGSPCSCSCVCPIIYGTTSMYCEEQEDLCDLFQDCVVCLVVNTKEVCLVSERGCSGDTENVSIVFIDAIDDTMYEINGIMAMICQASAECTFNYYYAIENTEELPIHVERCPGPGFPYYWAVPVIVVAVVLLVGLLVLLIIKLVLLAVEHVDYKKFVDGMQTAEWAPHDNPLYVNPQQNYKNVLYKRNKH